VIRSLVLTLFVFKGNNLLEEFHAVKSNANSDRNLHGLIVCNEVIISAPDCQCFAWRWGTQYDSIICAWRLWKPSFVLILGWIKSSLFIAWDLPLLPSLEMPLCNYWWNVR
jgi:hypothetical protein